MSHDIRAELTFLPQSAQKVRLVLDTVRGLDANQALGASALRQQAGR